MDKTDATVIDVLREIQKRMDTLEGKIDTISKTLGTEIDKIEEKEEELGIELNQLEENLAPALSAANLSRKTKKIVKLMQGVGSNDEGFIMVDDILSHAQGHRIGDVIVRDALDELHRCELITNPAKNEIKLKY